MTNEQKKLQKKIETLSQSIQTYESTGADKNFLELSKRYQCDRKRIHNAILRRYGSLFAIIGNLRELSILGVQNVDLLFSQNAVDFSECIKRYQALKPMMIKFREAFDEMICLIENGFIDGAIQRWRTLWEYTVIIIFIIQHGETVAEAYVDNYNELLKDGLRPRTNLAWAKAADCLKEEKQISIKKLLENIAGIDTRSKVHDLGIYKLTSQLIHGSSLGLNMSFTYLSEGINDLPSQHIDDYNKGISMAISQAVKNLLLTYMYYLKLFPDGGLKINSLWGQLQKIYTNEFVKVFKGPGNLKPGEILIELI